MRIPDRGYLCTCTWHIREHENAFVEIKGQKVVLQVLQNADSDKEREGTVAKQQCIPEMVYFVKGEDICRKEEEEEGGGGREGRGEEGERGEGRGEGGGE